MRKLLLAALLAGGAAVPANAFSLEGWGVWADLYSTTTYMDPSMPDETTHIGDRKVPINWPVVYLGSAPEFCGDDSYCVEVTTYQNTVNLSFLSETWFPVANVNLVFENNLNGDIYNAWGNPFLSGNYQTNPCYRALVCTYEHGQITQFALPDRPTVPTNPVPEPATWAMMAGGLALAGAAMRRRKMVVSFA